MSPMALHTIQINNNKENCLNISIDCNDCNDCKVWYIYVYWTKKSSLIV